MVSLVTSKKKHLKQNHIAKTIRLKSESAAHSSSPASKQKKVEPKHKQTNSKSASPEQKKKSPAVKRMKKDGDKDCDEDEFFIAFMSFEGLGDVINDSREIPQIKNSKRLAKSKNPISKRLAKARSQNGKKNRRKGSSFDVKFTPGDLADVKKVEEVVNKATAETIKMVKIQLHNAEDGLWYVNEATYNGDKEKKDDRMKQFTYLASRGGLQLFDLNQRRRMLYEIEKVYLYDGYLDWYFYFKLKKSDEYKDCKNPPS